MGEPGHVVGRGEYATHELEDEDEEEAYEHDLLLGVAYGADDEPQTERGHQINAGKEIE